MKQHIAFLGLGKMGSPMAQNLARAGLTVKAWNRTPNRPLVQQAAQAGVEVVPTIQEAVKGAEMIFTCVSDVQDVEQIIFGSGGITDSAESGAIIVDFSTIGPLAAQEFAETLKSYNLNYMDAPVSGGDVGAQNGTLTIMVGGDKVIYERYLPILQAVGKRITYCGAVGSGQAVKLYNQTLCAIHMVALCEAMQLAKTFSLDPQLVVDVCGTGAASSWALLNLGPKVANSDFAPGFTVKHILKDLRLVQESLGDLKLPGICLAEQMFKVVQELGGAEQGTQAMIRAYQEHQD